MPNAGELGRQELGRHLRRARHALGWTLDSLADRLGNEGVSVDPSTLSRIEKGSLPIDLNVASALSRCLGTSVSALEEILRSARRRKAIDLTGWDFDGLIAAGKEEVSKGDIYGALDYFEAARDWVQLQVAESDGDDRLAQALVLEAIAHVRLRNYMLAHEVNRRALNLPRISPDSRLRAILVEIMAGYYSGDFFRACTFAREAEALLDGQSDETRLLAFSVLGDLRFVQDDFEAAIPWLEKARDGYRRTGCERELCRTLIALGVCLVKTAHPQNGLRIALQGLTTAESSRFLEIVAWGHRLVGRIQLEQEHFEECRSHLQKAQKLAKALCLAHDEFVAYYYLWKLSLRNGTRAETSRCERALRRLLPQTDRESPVVRDFVASMRGARSQGRREE